MQAKGRSFPNWGYILLGAVAFAAFYFIKNLKEEDFFKLAGKHPDMVLSAMSGKNISPRILSRTGKIVSKNFQVDKPGSKRDSLTFRVILKGEKSTATIKTRVIMQPSGEWKMVKSDTVFTD
ncbi:hypothetical protein [Hymenobacter radiodurans]|uniref:hypothetical protein n=1 Tax=Hymenobacter radiodurans TaxID=2496028 RepID=UPI001059102C|nr:hypothetical protein [Hymenobacter radiodurans]